MFWRHFVFAGVVRQSVYLMSEMDTHIHVYRLVGIYCNVNFKKKRIIGVRKLFQAKSKICYMISETNCTMDIIPKPVIFLLFLQEQSLYRHSSK